MALDIDGVMRLAAHALSKGGKQVSPLRVEWDVSGRCLAPVARDLQATPYRSRFVRQRLSALAPSEWCEQVENTWIVYRPKWQHGFTVSMTVKCRKCERCRMERRNLWANRARREIACAHRTWFGTMTLRPEVYMRALNECRKADSTNGDDFDVRPFTEQFSRIHSRIGVEITKFVKRVRDVSGGPIRCLLVAEAHQSGVPHYHALIHEAAAGAYVKERCLSSQWPLGFSKWRLVGSLREAGYVCKYLSKDCAARVRASQSYGSASLEVGRTLSEAATVSREEIDPQKVMAVGARASTTSAPLFASDSEHSTFIGTDLREVT